jgi:hypothetical protein
VVIRWFCELCCGVVGSEGDTNVSVFKQVGDSAYVWGGKGEGCTLWAAFSVCGGCGACYSVLYLVFQFVKESSWEFVVFCNVEDGSPFTVLLVVVEGEVEHPLNVVSVCCKFVFN